MKKVNMILTFPKTLEEKNELLREAYKEAEKDPDRKKLITDWKVLDIEEWEYLIKKPYNPGTGGVKRGAKLK